MSTTVFIVNPKAGTGSKKKLMETLEAYVKQNEASCSLVVTSYRGHASELALKLVDDNTEMVVAVGGDGTVSEIARSLVHSNTLLGIIPAGSGNGLARHFGIPTDPTGALNVLANGKTKSMDTMLVNGVLSVNISGIGFDAHIASLFASGKKRGFLTYARLSLREFIRYVPFEYTLDTNGQQINKKSFMLVFANTSQWGNNAYIAPMASADDGLITTGAFNKPGFTAIPSFIWRLFTGRLKGGMEIEFFHSPEATIQCTKPVSLHIDGDAMPDAKEIRVVIQASSLRINIPSTYKS